MYATGNSLISAQYHPVLGRNMAITIPSFDSGTRE
jgi:hypothetical protein